jgi:hypothetical protein
MRLYPGWPRTLLANVKPTTRRFGMAVQLESQQHYIITTLRAPRLLE